jgi:carboxyl-terminal processing protease
MKKFVIAISAALALSSVAGAQKYIGSPAQDLFDQASFYLDANYWGFSKADVNNDLVPKFQIELDKACEAKGIQCSFEDAEKVVGALAEGMQDGHTYYLTPNAYRGYIASTQGQGAPTPRLGVRITRLEDKSILINRIRDDSDGYKVGLRRGDVVIKIGDKNLAELPETAFTEAIQTGRAFQITVRRGDKQLEFSPKGIIFQQAELASMETTPDGVALIYMPDFAARGLAAQKVNDLVKKAKESGTKHIILDLRDNSGGFIGNMTAVCSIFIADNQCDLIQNYRRSTTEVRWFTENGESKISNGKQEQSVFKMQNPVKWTDSMAVLINSGAGSAPEGLAGNLGYVKRCPLIGEPTFGIGNTATGPNTLINGGALFITGTKNFRADKSPYDERATPTVAIKDDLAILASQGRDVVLEKALETLGVRKTTVQLQPTHSMFMNTPKELNLFHREYAQIHY